TAEDHDEVAAAILVHRIDALVLDRGLDADGVPVTRAAAHLGERRRELPPRLRDAGGGDRQRLPRRLGDAAELAGGELAGRLQAGRFALARGHVVAIRQQGADGILTCIRRVLAGRVGRRPRHAAGRLVVLRNELAADLVVAGGLHRRGAL